MNKKVIIGKGTGNPLIVNRPGYGTMRLTGEGFWGEPKDRKGAIALLREAVELGVNYFDTADFYGPGVTNRLLTEALYPYAGNSVIGTKVGTIRGKDKSWLPYGKPEELRSSIENNLKELKMEQLQLVHYGKSPHSSGTFEEGLETMLELQREGKILHLGLSNASVEQFKTAVTMGEIATVENIYSYTQRITDPESPYGFQGGEVLPMCEEHEIPFIPFFSLETSLPYQVDKIKKLAEERGVSIAQMNISWLLHKSPYILPIPGTTSIAHLQENIQAKEIQLSEEDLKFLE